MVGCGMVPPLDYQIQRGGDIHAEANDQRPAPGRSVERIGDLLDLDLATFLAG